MHTLLTRGWRGGYDLLVKTRRLRIGGFHFATLEEARRVERLFLRISGVAK